MIRKLIIYLNYALISLTLISALACVISPQIFSWISIAGLAFPVLAILNFLFIFYWLFNKRKKPVFISLLAMIALLPLLHRTFGYTPFNPVKGDVKIMSFNAKNFDLYKWSGEEGTRDEMLARIKAEAPDILCIQEFHTEKRGRLRNLEYIQKEMDLQYTFFNESHSFRRNHYWGVAIFSKHPISNKETIKFDNSKNQCIYADLEINGHNVRLFNAHLESIHLDEEDYDYIDQVTEEQDPRSTKKITDKFRNAAKIRTDQAKKVSKAIKEFEGNKIVVGDFNDTPISFSYQLLSTGLKDAFSKKGFGIGNTYINKYPFFRIDHILMSKEIEINSFDVVHMKGSDHYPISATFSF